MMWLVDVEEVIGRRTPQSVALTLQQIVHPIGRYRHSRRPAVENVKHACVGYGITHGLFVYDVSRCPFKVCQLDRLRSNLGPLQPIHSHSIRAKWLSICTVAMNSLVNETK